MSWLNQFNWFKSQAREKTDLTEGEKLAKEMDAFHNTMQRIIKVCYFFKLSCR